MWQRFGGTLKPDMLSAMSVVVGLNVGSTESSAMMLFSCNVVESTGSSQLCWNLGRLQLRSLWG